MIAYTFTYIYIKEVHKLKFLSAKQQYCLLMLPTFLSIFHLVVLDRTLYMFIISLLYYLILTYVLCLPHCVVWTLLAFFKFGLHFVTCDRIFRNGDSFLFFNLKTDSIFFLTFLVFFLMLIVFFL